MTKRIGGALLAACLVVATVSAGDDQRVIEAAKAGDWSAVPALLKSGVDPSAASGDGTTALHWAAYRDQGDTVDLLIRAGAKVNAVNDLGATALWAATENGSAPMVARLLKAGANPNLALLSGETALMNAARTGSVEVVRLLLAAGANANAREREYQQTALMWAAAESHPGAVELLLKAGADIHARATSYKKMVKTTPEQASRNVAEITEGGYTALLFAARSGDLASAKLLVAAKANVNDTAPSGTSAMVVAAHSGHGEVATLLAEKGADPNAIGAGYAAIHAAIVQRDEPLVAALLQAGANPNLKLLAPTASRRQSGDVYMAPAFVGATPFWLAARYAEPGIMRLLVRHGADAKFVHHMDYWAQGIGYADLQVIEGPTTALMAASGMGHRLFRWEGDPEIDRDEEERRTLAAVTIAVEQGIDVNAANADGNTALHTAASRGHESVVKFLIEKGARPDLKNNSGRTAAEMMKAGSRRPD